VLCPEQILSLKSFASKYRADFHAHNDYGLATANTLAAVKAGFCGVHATINGMGERAGNAALEEVVVAIHDFTNRKTNINEKALKKVSELVEKLSGKRVPSNKPIVGENVFTQTAGIHADGDKKGNLYVSRLRAERFGRKRVYALGKLSGKASIEMAIKRLGIELNENERGEVVKRVVALSEKKEKLTEADLLFIVSDVIKKGGKRFFEIKEFQGITLLDGKAGAMFKVRIGNEVVERASRGVGIFDAFMNGIRQLAKEKDFVVPRVKDYYVGIPRGGKSDALVEVVVEWENGEEFKTIGVDQDQVIASIKAVEKAINFANFMKQRINGE
jgi:D-citramalate synthase